MNIKTLARAAKKVGCKLVIRKSGILGETLYTLQDKEGNEVVGANNKEYLFHYLPYLVEHIHTPEAEALVDRFLR